MLRIRWLTIFIIMLCPTVVNAAFDQNKIYFGGGVGINSKGEKDDATGFQFFAGYPLEFTLGKSNSPTSIEIGYTDSGNFDSGGGIGRGSIGRGKGFKSNSDSGLWVTGITEYELDSDLDLVGRVGLNIGANGGLIFGGGLGYHLSRETKLRGEYIIMDGFDSLQLNYITEF